jgi:hypothetical protein
MEITPLFLVLAAAVGLLVGLLVASLFNSRDSKRSNNSTLPEVLTKEGYAEAARLYYSPARKNVVTALDEEYYADFQALSPEQKNRVFRLLTMWATWAGRSQYEPKPEPASTDSQPLIVNGGNLPPIQPVLEPAVQKVLKEPTEDEPFQEPMAAPPKTIAGQISLIIEKMLEDHPLKEKGIQLIENAHHGVDVWVGMEKFEGIDAIPYPEAQQLIRSAVAQWERETEAGRLKP